MTVGRNYDFMFLNLFIFTRQCNITEINKVGSVFVSFFVVFFKFAKLYLEVTLTILFELTYLTLPTIQNAIDHFIKGQSMKQI